VKNVVVTKKKKSQRASTKASKEKDSAIPKVGNKREFDRLLDDAIFGVKKK